VQAVGDSVFRPAFEICAKSISAGLICVALFVVNPLASVVVIMVLGGGYIGLYSLIRMRMNRLGIRLREANRLKTRAMHECFSGIKVAKVMGLESHLLKQFEKHSSVMARAKVTQNLANIIPFQVMEVFVFSLVVVGTLYVVSTFENFAEAIPVLGLYAFGAYRVKPGFQSIYHSLVNIQTGLPRVEAVHEHLQELGAPAYWRLAAKSKSLVPTGSVGTDLSNAPIVEFCGVDFQYESAAAPTLQDINIRIMRNTTVGIRGATGSGKTTIVDLIMGLLMPSAGAILVDGKPLETEAAVRAWQRRVGYVPQDIYLTDGSIAENIAYGTESDKIDPEAVRRAATMAQIADFVETQLPDGYKTEVGERGVRLSGGQRQRIGIARALYHNPDVLVFDEATSALDNETEAALMQSVHALAHQLTIIMVAHRLSTLEGCDEVVRLEEGRVIETRTMAPN
jgi:ABC-type multidrug transport system fused ATPase/permease subunit